MAKQLYALSTLTNDNTYRQFGPFIPGAARTVVQSVTIAGKAGLPNKNLITPRGVVTPVTDEQVTMLREDKVFRIHEEGGWITILDMDPRDADKKASDQNEGDKSRLLTEKDLKAGTKAKKD